MKILAITIVVFVVTGCYRFTDDPRVGACLAARACGTDQACVRDCVAHPDWREFVLAAEYAADQVRVVDCDARGTLTSPFGDVETWLWKGVTVAREGESSSAACLRAAHAARRKSGYRFYYDLLLSRASELAPPKSTWSCRTAARWIGVWGGQTRRGVLARDWSGMATTGADAARAAYTTLETVIKGTTLAGASSTTITYAGGQCWPDGAARPAMPLGWPSEVAW